MNRVRPASEAGFVLIGVIMFVLALTILGLSLFSLSGYEVQFMEESRQELQAFYAATGGIERAKLMIQTHNRLDAVRKALPGVEGIVYTRARFVDFPNDTDHIMQDEDWSLGRELEIRVLAVERGKRRMVEARYRPIRASTIYENLITSAGKVMVRPEPPSFAGSGQLSVSGSVFQKNADTTWVTEVLRPPFPRITVGQVPNPAVQEYMNTYLGSAQELNWREPLPHQYSLLAAGGTQFFRGPVHERANFAFGDGDSVDVYVSGTAIWLLPGGGTFERTVNIHGTPADRLIIVATKSAETDAFRTTPALQAQGFIHTALHFEGGLHSPDHVPVILVADGPIAIDQHHWSSGVDQDRTIWVSYLSVFAPIVLLCGPDPNPAHGPDPTSSATATYAHDSTRDAAVLDPLCLAGLLPNTTGFESRRFVALPGTWREVNESDPN